MEDKPELSAWPPSDAAERDQAEYKKLLREREAVAARIDELDKELATEKDQVKWRELFRQYEVGDARLAELDEELAAREELERLSR